MNCCVRLRVLKVFFFKLIPVCLFSTESITVMMSTAHLLALTFEDYVTGYLNLKFKRI